MRDVEIKRVYDAPTAADGYRVLVAHASEKPASQRAALLL
jgi:uncharacterized protein YeaO (DUF488 family)